jgi:hypothetical protein
MFIGHYGVSLALKRARPSLSLGGLFLAVQLLDVFFCLFVLLGVEKMRIVPGFTAYNAYDLYFMPYTHSLLGALLWAAAAALAVLLLWRAPQVAAALAGLAVFSHFLLDVPVHTPDLPLAAESSFKLGFSLWNHRLVALALEVGCLGVGLALYLWTSRPRVPGGRWLALGTSGFLLAFACATPFLPPPPSPQAFAVQALASYLLLAGLAVWLDRSRTPAPQPGPPKRAA